MEKTCEFCGKKYETSHVGSKFCSFICYRRRVADDLKKLYRLERKEGRG